MFPVGWRRASGCSAYDIELAAGNPAKPFEGGEGVRGSFSGTDFSRIFTND
jgi:hypothetical protein